MNELNIHAYTNRTCAAMNRALFLLPRSWFGPARANISTYFDILVSVCVCAFSLCVHSVPRNEMVTIAQYDIIYIKINSGGKKTPMNKHGKRHADEFDSATKRAQTKENICEME